MPPPSTDATVALCSQEMIQRRPLLLTKVKPNCRIISLTVTGLTITQVIFSS